MSYVALYRKFRPDTFAQIKGQDHVVRALKYQLINKRIGHAYLFTGTRGTGKTSAAKIFAKAVNCLNPKDAEPCNECENCRSINAGNFVDVAEVDAASNNGVDDIRRIIEEVRYTPVKGAYKVFIIDEAHMITGAAFNAFLKTLEEPPAYAVFILATTEPHKLPVTILSRVQRYDFRRISTGQIAENLAQIVGSEGIPAQDKALRYIARMGDGSMRDSISLLDKCIAFNLGEDLTYENVLDTLGTVDTEVFSSLFRRIYASDAANALKILDNAVDEGRDLSQFASDFIWYLRNVLMAGAAGLSDMEMLGVSAENMALIAEDARNASPEVLMRYIRILSETIDRMRFSSGRQILLEVAVIKLAKPQMESDTQSLADRIRQLEEKSAAIVHMPAGRLPDTVISEEPDEADYVPALRRKMTNPDALAGLLDDMPAGAPAQPSPGTGRPQQAAGSSADMPGTGADKAAGIWQEMLNNCESRMIKASLNKCTCRMSEDETLEIMASSDFIAHQLKDEQVLESIKNLALRVSGRKIQVRILHNRTQDNNSSTGNAGQAGAAGTVFPEELLNNINFNIGTEEN